MKRIPAAAAAPIRIDAITILVVFTVSPVLTTAAGAAFVPMVTTNGENVFVSNVRVRSFAL